MRIYSTKKLPDAKVTSTEMLAGSHQPNFRFAREFMVLTIELAGWFTWDGTDFSHSANEINLRDGIHLEAMLKKRDGGYRELQGINLNERISNENGRLTFGKDLSYLFPQRDSFFNRLFTFSLKLSRGADSDVVSSRCSFLKCECHDIALCFYMFLFQECTSSKALSVSHWHIYNRTSIGETQDYCRPSIRARSLCALRLVKL